MPRLEVELTSSRPDGTWTWRKAGARQPKGDVDGTLVPAGSKVGDVLRVETEQMVEGIEITSVLPAKAARVDKFDRIEITRPEPKELVSSQLVAKGRKDDRGRDRRPRGDGDRPRRDNDRPRRDGDRPSRDRPAGERSERPDRGPRRPDRAPAPERPRPKRLRPLRTHRDAVLESLAPELRPVAEQVLKGGVPAVRQALDEQNAKSREAGLPEVSGDELLGVAEKMVPQLRRAEWRDRADAALKVIDELDLRDLRSVVVAGAESARDDESRAVAAQLKDALGRRVEEEHAAWLAELSELLDQERVVRALRLSSRPPKAGVPLPPEMATRLAAQASAALTSDTLPDRWGTVLDALSFSPVRTAVNATSLPDPVPDTVRDAVAAASDRLPHIAAAFGIDPATVPKSAKRRGPLTQQRRGSGGKPGGPAAGGGAGRSAGAAGKPKGDRPKADKPDPTEPTPESEVESIPVAEATVAEETTAAPVEAEATTTPEVAVEPPAEAATDAVVEAETSGSSSLEAEAPVADAIEQHEAITDEPGPETIADAAPEGPSDPELS
jgi:hypothetical protein